MAIDRDTVRTVCSGESVIERMSLHPVIAVYDGGSMQGVDAPRAVPDADPNNPGTPECENVEDVDPMESSLSGPPLADAWPGLTRDLVGGCFGEAEASIFSASGGRSCTRVHEP